MPVWGITMMDWLCSSDQHLTSTPHLPVTLTLPWEVLIAKGCTDKHVDIIYHFTVRRLKLY